MLNQILIGKYIAKKRKEKNLTQVQLAEKLSVSNKTISKWENGNSMPDYGVIELLCNELNISISELLDGEDKKETKKDSDNIKLIFLLRRMQKLDKQNKLITGFLMIVFSVALFSLSKDFSDSDTMNFLSGLFIGLSSATLLAGIIFMIKVLRRYRKW